MLLLIDRAGTMIAPVGDVVRWHIARVIEQAGDIDVAKAVDRRDLGPQVEHHAPLRGPCDRAGSRPSGVSQWVYAASYLERSPRGL